MHLLDTATVIDFLNGNRSATTVVAGVHKTTCISAITVAELWDSKNIHHTKAIEDFIEGVEVLPFSTAMAKHSARIASTLAQEGKKIPLGDALIAGAALSLGATIVTRDEHFTRIPGLTVLKY